MAPPLRRRRVSYARATPDRLIAFSDAVFAVLITVLVKGLAPPGRPTFALLLTLWPTRLSYAVSYLFIAIVWVHHHHLCGTPPRQCRGSS
ncbi:MAG TPA: TMEM175 family protein, partial [Gemmatimonadales bacterium]|nr:TMEM175 family protein [Gemmatimonadales bacterium]